MLSRTLPIIGGGVVGRNDAELSLLHDRDGALAFADALDAPQPFRGPAWLARPLAGKDTVWLLTRSMPTTNDAFKRETGWEPTYPTYQEGLEQVVQTWVDDGTLRETSECYEWDGE